MSEAEGPEAAIDYQVELPEFEGPLDLLLHLVKKHELDILDIPIAFITDRYLQMLDVMRSLNLDVAGEYLLMAATLAHLKSRELVPPDPAEDAALAAEGDEEETRSAAGADPPPARVPEVQGGGGQARRSTGDRAQRLAARRHGRGRGRACTRCRAARRWPRCRSSADRVARARACRAPR